MNRVENPSRLVIAISSRALFDLAESHRVFEQEGIKAYCEYQIAHEDDALAPGVAFPLARKLLALNEAFEGAPAVEIILLSRNSSDTGLRVFNSIEHHGLTISRAAFTGGASPYRYISAFGSQLFLSADPDDVRKALESGFAAATILPSNTRVGGAASEQLRIAFDGDAVLFSDEAEKIYKQHGLEVFSASEKQAARKPLSGSRSMFPLSWQWNSNTCGACPGPARRCRYQCRTWNTAGACSAPRWRCGKGKSAVLSWPVC